MQPRIIAVVNHKGGVGKTTSTLNLGKALSLMGKRVLLVDIDPQANLTQHVGLEEPARNLYHAICESEPLPVEILDEGLHIAPADLELSEAELRLKNDVNGYFRLKEALEGVKNAYDYVLIDCPPSLSILTINALIAASEVLVVVQAEYLATKGLQTILNLIDELRKNLNPKLEVAGMLLTQVDHTVIRRSIVEQVRSIYKGKVFDTVIRSNVALTEASAMHQDIFSYNPHCYGAEDYMQLAKEVEAATRLAQTTS
ncbi:ParA family protein [Thermonema rossianum]|jgi:chromosome partitioning protein|uniref:ParA family protein n=1 Tax=Thermonema rossianum TaxID=55505 RepID=UPI00056FA1A0|nr:ParA family protein [Thermonema rossianum]